MDKNELSLQSLYDLIQKKADNNHTHTFIGSIESALSLQGISYENFARKDLKDEEVKAYYDEVTRAISSKNTTITLKAQDNRAKIEINNKNLSTHNLTVTGNKNEDVVVNVKGRMLINESPVLTMDDAGKITGVNFDDLDVSGQGIIVDEGEPTKTKDHTIWGKVESEDNVTDTTPIANNTMYTVPVGTIIRHLSTSIPNGFLRANGQVVSRVAYRGLWEFAKARAPLVTDADWQALYKNSTTKILKYSYGNGTDTFRLPNIPTGDDTIYMVKAFDELSTRQQLNLATIEANVKELQNNKVVTGIGFMKFADGGLIQYGISYGNTCYYTLPFIDNTYTILPNYEGSAKGVDIAIINKGATNATFAVTNATGVTLTSAKINFLAIGRWK